MDLYIEPLAEIPDEFHPPPAGEMGMACWMGLAAILNIRLCIREIALPPDELAFTDVLIRMGVRIREEILNITNWSGNLQVRGARLKGIELPPQIVPKVWNELAIIAVVAAFGVGKTTVRARILKERPRYLDLFCRSLRAMHVELDQAEDGFVITGGPSLQGAELDCENNAVLALALSVAGLVARGETVLRHVGDLAELYPGFFRVLAGESDAGIKSTFRFSSSRRSASIARNDEHTSRPASPPHPDRV